MTAAKPVEGVVEPRKVDSLAAAYAEVRKEPYEFEWPEGRFWTLPHLSELDYRLLAEIEDIGDKVADLSYLEGLFARIFGPEQAAAWAEVQVPTAVLMMLFDRYIKHAGGELGEGEASKPSLKNTGTKSRQTSAASTGSASPKRSTAKPAKATSGRRATPRGRSSAAVAASLRVEG